MIWLYSKFISNRLIYTADIFIGKGQYTITTDQSILFSDQLCINYSNETGGSKSLQIMPHGILSETVIAQQEIKIKSWHQLPIFFETNGSIPFDVLAASFYLISRYEEYLPHEKDSYGRYHFKNSIAYQYQFLDLPLIELWQQALHETMHAIDENYACKKEDFKIRFSYDIDMSFKYKGKGLLRNCGGFLKDIFQLKTGQALERIAVILGLKNDPFDLFDIIQEAHQKRQQTAKFFFLMSAKSKGYDKNISPLKKVQQTLIQKIASTSDLGLHPSAASNDGNDILMQEKKKLERITDRPISDSRQHYILMDMPHTYQVLIVSGITADYSMGYGGINGFRASYSRPYKWFDISSNTTTSLMIHPFCWMDANCIFNEKKTPALAQQQLEKYLQILQQTGGICTVIFHNHFLVFDNDNNDWCAVWEWLHHVAYTLKTNTL